MAKTATVLKAAAAIASVIVLAVAFIAGTVSSATAVQGQAAVAGVVNTETSSTGFVDDSYSTTCNGVANAGLVACGNIGGQFSADATGVSGTGATIGVSGHATGTGLSGNGVEGQVSNEAGSGVYGNNGGVGYGVTGQADDGTGIFGASTNSVGILGLGKTVGIHGEATGSGGAGIEAASVGNNLALRVDGKAQFSRSGKAVVLGGQSSVVVSGAAIVGKSLILATPQKNVAGVYVQGVVPDTTAHTFTIYLNTTVGGKYPVAWMVVERP